MAPDADATAGPPQGWHDLEAVLAEEPVARLLAAYLAALRFCGHAPRQGLGQPGTIEHPEGDAPQLRLAVLRDHLPAVALPLAEGRTIGRSEAFQDAPRQGGGGVRHRPSRWRARRQDQTRRRRTMRGGT